jgi:hypothetical protein
MGTLRRGNAMRGLSLPSFEIGGMIERRADDA